jgi:aldehyde dehydrogenase (NAD+)
MQALRMYIDGRWTDGSTTERFDSIDPATGECWATIPKGTPADVDAAVVAAHRAFKSGPWANMTATQRGALLRRIGDLIAANAERLGELETRDSGKLSTEMAHVMRYMPEWYYYYGGLADKIEGAVTPIDKPGIFQYISYDPLGVVAAIAPWNQPLLLATWKIAPALAAGNTVVVKPSEFSSASTLALAEIMEQAGVPPGVFNVITGFPQGVGEPLVQHPLVAKIAFTGSDSGGRHVYQNAARHLKRASMELGGKSANIIFADAEMDDAVRGAVAGIFGASGQSCMAGSRLLVQRSIHDEFVDRLVSFVSKARVGNPRDPATNIGPITTPPQVEKILSYVEIAKGEGARCAFGGKRATVEGFPNGLYVEPTIFTGVNNQMRIAREEVFGPVLSVIPFDTVDEAIEIANDTDYGLAAGIWTRDLEKAVMLPRRLTAGTVWVNAYRMVSFMAPFGGFKASGVGRENGQRTIYEYLEAKSVFVNPGKGVPDPFLMR